MGREKVRGGGEGGAHWPHPPTHPAPHPTHPPRPAPHPTHPPRPGPHPTYPPRPALLLPCTRSMVHTQLRELNVQGASNVDSLQGGLVHMWLMLGGKYTLRALNLRGYPGGATTVYVMKGHLTALTALDLSETHQETSSVLCLAGMPLQHLALSSNPRLGDEAIQLLGGALGLISLRRLSLDATGVADGVWGALAALPLLEWVDLSSTAVICVCGGEGRWLGCGALAWPPLPPTLLASTPAALTACPLRRRQATLRKAHPRSRA